VAGLFALGGDGGSGSADIGGGTLNLSDPAANDWIKGSSVLNVAGAGTIVIKGNHYNAVQAYVAGGKITGNGGSTVYCRYNAAANETTIAAEYIPPVETVWEPMALESTDGQWTTAENWRQGLPGSVSKAVLNVPGSTDCTVAGSASAGRVVMGEGGAGGRLIVANGGSLSVGAVDWTGIGWTSTGELVVEEGGSATFGHHLWVGFNPGAEGTVTVTGGTLNVNQMTGLGWGGGKGIANITGGTVNLAQFHPDNSIKGESVMDVSGTGRVVITGNHYDAVKNYVAAGKIKSGGSSHVIYYYDAGANRTIISTVVPAQLIQSVSVDAGTVTVTFQTVAGQTYRIDSSPSVSPATWLAVPGTSVTATGPTTTVSFPVGPTDEVFYRSVLE
jgi:hypothetical protein